MKPERLAYRIDEAAESMGVSPRMIYYLIEAGKLSTVKIGRRTLIPADDLRALVGKQK